MFISIRISIRIYEKSFTEACIFENDRAVLEICHQVSVDVVESSVQYFVWSCYTNITKTKKERLIINQ